MMMRILLSFIFLFFGFNHSPAEADALAILDKMLTTIDGVNSLKFQLKVTERIKGKLVVTGSKTKLNRSPRKLYMNVNGPELLWVEGWNDGYALVNPNGFPYINLNLNPMGSLLRDGQHHTIHEIGFEYYASIIKSCKKTAGSKFVSYLKNNGDVKWNNRDCYFLSAEFSDFKYINYTVLKGENVLKIAKKFFISEYMIVEVNKDQIDDYEDVKPGQVIKIPNYYAKKTEIYIDKTLMLPVHTKIYDDKGLYESFEYISITVNPKFAVDEFSKTFKDYNF